MRVLIVKLTSMGDLIHALPAITDAKRAIPDIEFDWVLDEAFADVALMHPGVSRIIKSAHRRWSKNKWQSLKSGDLWRFWRELRTKRYDIVLDAQNNIKSAIVTLLSRGLRCGTDKQSVREAGAHLVYQKTVALPDFKNAHAVDRQRSLFAAALGYERPTTPADFGIDLQALPALNFTLPKPYLIFMHSTTWNSKHWPESYWVELIKLATAAGYHIVLPWGGKSEHERAQRLGVAPNTTVLPRLRIIEQAQVIRGATAVITVDTGLAHLTAALNIPAIHLYGPTDMNLLGIKTPFQKFLVAEFECAPCYLRQCKWTEDSKCFVTQLPPNVVWQQFVEHMQQFR